MTGLRDTTKSRFKTCVNTIRIHLLEDLEQACYQRYSLNARDRGKVRLSYRENLHYKRLFAWLSDPARPHSDWKDNLKDLVKERAYTLTNRMVILMQLECRGLRKVKFISQGVEKSPFRTEQDFFVALTQGNDQGFGFILQQIWDQLALELPALFEYNEVHECVPVPGPTLLWLIEELNREELSEAWTDDTTLGWLYQYWNDPDKTFIEKKLKGDGMPKGKVESHEIGKKTQLFTDHYMVEWLLHNSIGDQWRAICKKNNWVEKEELVKNWKGYIWRDLEPTYVEASVNCLENLKILDPAMGSGHFLVVAFDLLYSLYQFQRELQGKEFSASETVDIILSRNIHGIDIDSRAVQIGAAALYIKAKEKAPDVSISSLQIVATDLGLDHIDKNDKSIQELRKKLSEEIGIKPIFIDILIENLKYSGSLGSLIQLSKDIKEALENKAQIDVIFDVNKKYWNISKENKEKAVYEALEEFIKNYSTGDDLGLQYVATRLEKGIRLIHILRQRYDILCANPPYLSTSSISTPIAEKLERYSDIAKGDLYALFFICFENLTRDHGLWCVVAQHNWMFLGSFSEFRKHILRENALLKCSHLGPGAFEAIGGEVVGSSMIVAQKTPLAKSQCIFHRLVSCESYSEKQKAVYNPPQQNTYTFSQSRFADISGSPMIYWWPEEFRQAYLEVPKLGNIGEVRQGMATSSNNRFLRKHFEIESNKIGLAHSKDSTIILDSIWYPYLKGAAGKRWFEDLSECINYSNDGLEVKQYANVVFKNWTGRIINRHLYFKQGIAFNSIGTDGFLCRLRKYKSIFDVVGSTIFCDNPEKMQVILSSALSGYVAQSLNPTIHNQVGDIVRLPVFEQLSDCTIYLKRAKSLYDRQFASTESNLEYTYQHLDPENFEVEDARIRDEIDKEILEQFSPETINAIYQEIGESVFDFPLWDGESSFIPDDFKESYQTETSILELSRRYRLHPDSVLMIKDKLGLVHEGQRKDEAFKHFSWAVGVLLGRFDAQTGGLVDLAEQRRDEQGLLPDPQAPKAHDHGLLYLTALNDCEGLNRNEEFNMGNACLKTLESILHYKWGGEKGLQFWNEIENALVLDCRTDWTPAQRSKKKLNNWIRTAAFKMHLDVYEKRPIYFPLVSEKRNFFLWVNIHRWNDGTLNSILANYLNPDITLLTSRIQRLREERHTIRDSRRLNAVEKEIAELDGLLDELKSFTEKVSRLATRGPDPAVQEVEAPYVMDLDDGVMVNSAALWELVFPLWKDPKKWWTSLPLPKGKKDFDWSHLAMRYWPDRVMEKVKKDPSLAVAHSDYGAFKGRDLFKELHPEAAEKWEKQQSKPEDKTKGKPVQMEMVY